jgi:hypothetical protein
MVCNIYSGEVTKENPHTAQGLNQPKYHGSVLFWNQEMVDKGRAIAKAYMSFTMYKNDLDNKKIVAVLSDLLIKNTDLEYPNIQVLMEELMHRRLGHPKAGLESKISEFIFVRTGYPRKEVFAENENLIKYVESIIENKDTIPNFEFCWSTHLKPGQEESYYRDDKKKYEYLITQGLLPKSNLIEKSISNDSKSTKKMTIILEDGTTITK